MSSLATSTDGAGSGAGADWTLVCDRVRLCRGDREALRELSCTIASHECVCLIGPNGAGKTSLLLALLGILRPASGRVSCRGRDVHRLAARSRGRLLSYVPQTIEGLPPFTVRDFVAAGRYPYTSPLLPLTDRDLALIDGALHRCGLAALAGRRVTEISGGERQKALLAAAIAQDARVLCLDEPNTALDPAVQLDLARLLSALHAEGRGVIVTSHDLQLPRVLGDRVLALREGALVADGPADEVLEPARLARIYEAPFRTARTDDGHVIVVPDWWHTTD